MPKLSPQKQEELRTPHRSPTTKFSTKRKATQSPSSSPALVLSPATVALAFKRLSLFYEFVISVCLTPKSADQPLRPKSSSIISLKSWFQKHDLWHAGLEEHLVEVFGPGYHLRSARELLMNKRQDDVDLCSKLAPSKLAAFHSARSLFKAEMTRTYTRVDHTYVTTGPVISTFEYVRRQTPENEIMRQKDEKGRTRVVHSRVTMQEVVENSINDIRTLLRALSHAGVEGSALANAISNAHETNSPLHCLVKATDSNTNAACPIRSRGFEAIHQCLAAIFESPYLYHIGCHLARREYDSGMNSFSGLGNLLNVILRSAGPACDNPESSTSDTVAERYRLVEQIVRACLEGLREPSIAEGNLYSRGPVRQMRHAFVEHVLYKKHLLRDLLSRHFDNPDEDNEDSKSNMLFIFERTMHTLTLTPNGSHRFKQSDINSLFRFLFGFPLNQDMLGFRPLGDYVAALAAHPSMLRNTIRACNAVNHLISVAQRSQQTGVVDKLIVFCRETNIFCMLKNLLYHTDKTLHAGKLGSEKVQLHDHVGHHAQNPHEVEAPLSVHLVEACARFWCTLCTAAPAETLALLRELTIENPSPQQMTPRSLQVMGDWRALFLAALRKPMGNGENKLRPQVNLHTKESIMRLFQVVTCMDYKYFVKRNSSASIFVDLLPQLHSHILSCLTKNGSVHSFCDGVDVSGRNVRGAPCEYLGVDHRYAKLQSTIVQLVVSLTACFEQSRQWICEPKVQKQVCAWLRRPQTAGAACMILSNCAVYGRFLRLLEFKGIWEGLKAGVFDPISQRAAAPAPSSSGSSVAAVTHARRERQFVRRDQALLRAAAHLLRQLCLKSRWNRNCIDYHCAVLNSTELQGMLGSLDKRFLTRVCPYVHTRKGLESQFQKYFNRITQGTVDEKPRKTNAGKQKRQLSTPSTPQS